MLRAGVRPEVLLSSTALRARETAAVFARTFDAEVTEQSELYLAEPDRLLAAARAAASDEVMVVATTRA